MHRRGPRLEPQEPPIPINNMIRASEVRVIGKDREPLGVMSLTEAQELARENEVDVILVVPDASPPVVRLMTLDKYKYEQIKAEKETKKKQRSAVIETKELKLRPGTDVHDYQVRLRSAQKFLAKGNRVKLTLQFRGREMEFKSVGKEMFDRFLEDLGVAAVIEAPPQMVGRQMNMVLGPNKALAALENGDEDSDDA